MRKLIALMVVLAALAASGTASAGHGGTAHPLGCCINFG